MKQNRKHRYTRDQVLTAIRKSKGVMDSVAKQLGKMDDTECSWHVASRHVKRWKKTRNAFKFQKEVRVDRAEVALDKCVKKGDIGAIKYTLSTIGKDRGYTEKQEIELSGSVEMPLVVLKDEIGI